MNNLLLLVFCINFCLPVGKALFPYGTNDGDQILNFETESSSNAIAFTQPFLFYEHRHTEIYVMKDGLLSFSTPITSLSSSTELDAERKDLIAVFYAPSSFATVYYRSSTDSSSLLCREISAIIRRAFEDSNVFEAQETVLITWEKVQNIEQDSSNTFQLVLSTNGKESYAIFVFSQLEWYKSDSHVAQVGFYSADGRSEKLINSGTPGVTELARLTNINEQGLFLYRVSGAHPVDTKQGPGPLDDYEYTPEEGEYDPDDPLAGCPEDPMHDNCPGHCEIVTDDKDCSRCVCAEHPDVTSYSRVSPNEVFNVENAANAEILQTSNYAQKSRTSDLDCKNGRTECHVNAACANLDPWPRMCCKCVEGYFGNGVECLPKDQSFQRINGFFEAVINGKSIAKTDIFSYITLDKALQNTAITKVTPEFGYSLVLLDPIGSIMGWLFAKPSSNLPSAFAFNGFQLTGGAFTRTVTMHLGDRYSVLIRQTFTDRQLKDSFDVNITVTGTLPEWDNSVKVFLPDFEETYRKESPGFIRAYSERSIIVTENGEEKKYQVTTDQQIHFTECGPMANNEGAINDQIVRFEFINNVYNPAEHVIRYASQARVLPPPQQHNAAPTDPLAHQNTFPSIVQPDICLSGNHYCNQPNMVCRSYPPSYRCECELGYQHRPDDSVSARFHCVDIDECAERRHTCDVNAECENFDGSFRCTCKPGYSGDGHHCIGAMDSATAVDTNGGKFIVKNSCTRHKDCAEWGECVFTEAGRSPFCRCRGHYVGDGVTYCGPPEQQQRHHDNAPQVYSGQHYGSIGVADQDTSIMTAKICRSREECGNNADCVYSHEFNHYKCECLPSFKGDGIDCVLTIQNTHETDCKLKLGCHAHAHCVTNGSQTICQCAEGYVGDGLTCTPLHHSTEIGSGISEKKCADQSECHSNAHCIPADKSDKYICHCLPGYIGDGFTDCALSEECNPSGADSGCPADSNCEFSTVEQRFVCKCFAGFIRHDDRCVEQSQHHLVPQPHPSEAALHVPQPPPSRQINCLDDKRMCSQFAQCIPNERGDYVCNCNYGYRGNGQNCEPVLDANEGSLLIGRGMSIIQRSTKLDVPGKQLVVVPHQVVVDLAFDCVNQKIFWSDISGHAIRSVYLNGTGLSSSFNDDLRSPEGIAIDWSSRNLYYVDSIKNELGVVSLDGRYQKALLTEGLVNPRAMVIDVDNRHIYYSDWHRKNPHIGRIDLDGSNNQVFVSDDVYLPNGLTLLRNRRELCWADAGNQRLACIQLNGGGRRVVYAPLEYPFGLTCYQEERFYWTDWKDHKIHSVSVYGDGYTSFMPGAGGKGKIYGILSIPSRCHGAPTECSNNNGGCKYLCLPSRHSGSVCKCPDNLKNMDFNNGC